jgi:hypothetical protein
MSGARTASRLGLGFVVASFVVAVVAYPTVPEQMAIRWWVGLDMELHVDHAPKAVGLFVVPALSAVLFAALRVGPDLVGGAVADDAIRHVFTYVATGASALLLLVELALVWLN